jgi:GTP cyclohydrolase I
MMWHDHILVGETHNLADVLGRGIRTKIADPVCISQLGIHMVCPHHFTVSFGYASIAYIPGDRMVGFGRLSALAHAATARIVLQEDATASIVDTLMETLGCRAAACVIKAEHPCHRLSHPSAHRSQATTQAVRGPGSLQRILRELLTQS